MRHFAILAAALSIVTATRAPADAEDSTAFFESRIRPVLVEHCYKCHSGRAKSPKGGLRLDSREALLRGGVSGPAIVPGKPDDSLLIKALSHEGDVAEMPPDEKLPDRVIADFRRWIASGASDPRDRKPRGHKPAGGDVASARDFWAFRPPRDPGRPVGAGSRRGPGMSWIGSSSPDSKRRDCGRSPTPIAPPGCAGFRWTSSACHRRPRRSSRSSTTHRPWPGSAWSIDCWRHRRSASAGRRHWLDLTGYADQIGTANDIFAEHAWRYRDYVIAAFNADRPFDRFIREQLAGDLLPYDTPHERARNLIATGFLVLGDLTVVEADKAKLRVDVVDQQVDKVGKAFLGMTLGCARCHDHKFDPIRQRDYYALAGIFSSTESVCRAEWGVWSWPTIAELPETPAEQAERKARLEQHRQAIAALTAERERAGHRIGEIGAILQGQGKAQVGPGVSTRAGTRRHSRRSGASWRPASAQLAADIEHAEFFTPAVPVAFAVHDSAQAGRHADHDPGQRPRAGRPGPSRVRAGRLAEPAGIDPVR